MRVWRIYSLHGANSHKGRARTNWELIFGNPQLRLRILIHAILSQALGIPLSSPSKSFTASSWTTVDSLTVLQVSSTSSLLQLFLHFMLFDLHRRCVAHQATSPQRSSCKCTMKATLISWIVGVLASSFSGCKHGIIVVCLQSNGRSSLHRLTSTSPFIEDKRIPDLRSRIADCRVDWSALQRENISEDGQASIRHLLDPRPTFACRWNGEYKSLMSSTAPLDLTSRVLLITSSLRDPQQWVLLHTTFEALENARYVPDATPSFLKEGIGCYVGAATRDCRI
jgi:hypothetical protein